MKCPVCTSENVQKLSVIWESGTSNINTTGSTVGAGLGIGSLFGIGVASTKTSGTSQTLAAERTSPPCKKSLKSPLTSLLFGVFLVGSFKLVGGLLLVGGVVFLTIALRFNSNKWPALFNNWLGSWCCNKCGKIYQQEMIQNSENLRCEVTAQNKTALIDCERFREPVANAAL